MENEYYNITFAHEAGSITEGDIEPSSFWHSLQIPLKSLDDALQLINDLDNYAVEFTRFWEIQKHNSETFKEEVVERSDALKQYLEKEELTRMAFEQDRWNKVEELNKLDKEFIIEKDFHGYKIFIERGIASFNPLNSKDIRRPLKVRFLSNILNDEISFYIYNFKNKAGGLLKKAFITKYFSYFSEVPAQEMIDLLEKINKTYEQVRIENLSS